MDLAKLVGTWILSSEESTAQRKVYRTSAYDFPPVRAARPSLKLEPGGIARVGNAGATDASQRTTASWGVRGKLLNLILPQGEQDFEIEELSEQVLVLKDKT